MRHLTPALAPLVIGAALLLATAAMAFTTEGESNGAANNGTVDLAASHIPGRPVANCLVHFDSASTNGTVTAWVTVRGSETLLTPRVLTPAGEQYGAVVDVTNATAAWFVVRDMPVATINFEPAGLTDEFKWDVTCW